MPLQNILVAEFQSKAPASLPSFLVFFTANRARCVLAAMNVVSLLRSPFSQTIPEWIWPGTDGWTGCGNERQRHGVLVHPQAHCAHDSGNQKLWGACLVNETSTLMPSLLDTFIRVLQAGRLNCGPFH